MILCGLLESRDMIPVRVGLRFVVVVADELFVNSTLLQDSFVVDLSLRLGLELGDFGGLRLGLDVTGEICSSFVF